MTNYLTEFGVLTPEHPLRKLAKLVLDGAPKDIHDKIMRGVRAARDGFMSKNKSKSRMFHLYAAQIVDEITPLFGDDPELAPLLTEAYRVHLEAARTGPAPGPGGPRAPRRRAPSPDHRPGRPDRPRRARGPLDNTSKDLQGLDLEEMYQHASSLLGATVDELKEKYGHLNPGLVRMNLGNRLRKIQRGLA